MKKLKSSRDKLVDRLIFTLIALAVLSFVMLLIS